MSSTFDMVVRTPGGIVQTLQVRAADATAARERARQQGLLVLGCTEPAAATSSGSKWRRARRIDVATLSQELASLLAAGLSVIDALRTLAANESLMTRRVVLLEVVQAVSEGLPLSAALTRASYRFPPLLVATVSASEQTGDLATALARYAEHEQRVRALRDKVVGAAIYPMLLLAVGTLVVVFLLGVVVPKFAVLIESTRRELPWSSQLMISWGRFAAEHASAAAAAAATFVVAALLALRHVARRGARARWIEALPLIGSSIRLFRRSQLFRTAGMLVQGGIAAPKALQLAANLLGDDDRARLTGAIRRIHEGRSLSDALNDAGLADPVAAGMLAVAERTGALAEILQRIAGFQEARLQRSVELTSRLFEPLLMIGIGLVIGAIVVLMYLPIFDLASSLQ
jgi:general secretion pathway protein F